MVINVPNCEIVALGKIVRLLFYYDDFGIE